MIRVYMLLLLNESNLFKLWISDSISNIIWQSFYSKHNIHIVRKKKDRLITCATKQVDISTSSVRTIQVAVNSSETQLYEANSPYKYPVYKIDVKFRCRCATPPISNFPTDLKEGVEVGRQTFVADLPIYRVVVKLKRHVSQINWT